MSSYATFYPTRRAWLGGLLARLAGMVLGVVHGWLSQQLRVNDVAVGIAMIIFGSGIAFLLGKLFIKPPATQLPTIDLGN